MTLGSQHRQEHLPQHRQERLLVEVLMGLCSNCFASFVLVEHSGQWKTENKSYQISLKSFRVNITSTEPICRIKERRKCQIRPQLAPIKTFED